VYLTSRWQFCWPDGYSKEKFLLEHRVIFALWHNRLALGPGIFKYHKDIHALISPHSDGRVISNIVNKFGFGAISGSTNKNPIGALKQIITKLSSGSNIVITPDGPRGPAYKINSNITQIAKKYKAQLIPISANCSKYFRFKSWDRLIMPLPFGKIEVLIGEPLILSHNEEQNNLYLEQALMAISIDKG
jgi:lysophospholipid acyltransferase (LPLAT)-like uncharacterized protein